MDSAADYGSMVSEIGQGRPYAFSSETAHRGTQISMGTWIFESEEVGGAPIRPGGRRKRGLQYKPGTGHPQPGYHKLTGDETSLEGNCSQGEVDSPR
jgi:hypothetical protein